MVRLTADRWRLAGRPEGENVVPELIVNDVDDEVVEILEERAKTNGRTVEEEHMAYLQKYLIQCKGLTFLEFLSTMPDVGRDEDFERIQ